MKRFSILSSVTAVVIVLANAISAEAVDSTTTVTAATAAAPANWNVAGSWDNGVPNGVDDTARFSNIQTALRTLTLSTDTTIGHLFFDNGQNNRQNVIGVLSATAPILTFDAAGAGPATIDVTGAASGANTPNNIFGAVVLNDNLVVNVTRSVTTSAAGEFTIRQGTITGPGGITKNGTGVMTLADAPFKAYTGPTIINNGRLRLNPNSSLSGTSSILVNSGGQFDLEGAVDYMFGGDPNVVITLNGFGLGPASPAGNFPGAIRTGSGLLQAIENKIVLASDASIDVVSTNAATPGKLNLFNEVSGPGRLIANQKAGLITREGFLYLGHSNTYSGGTTIEQGTLTVTNFLATNDANLGTGSVMADGVTPAADFNPDGAASGKLAIETGITNAIADTAYLNLTGGGAAATPDRGAAILSAGINETVGGLMLGGVIQIAGTYGSTASGATFQSDEYFGGTGIVTVSATACGGGVCVPGDYNSNGVVDAGDYVVWKKGGYLANDFTPGNQAADYDFWRSRFGATTNPGSGSGLQNAAVPEPSTIALTGCLVSLLTLGRRGKSVLI